MKVAVTDGQGKLWLEDVPKPEPTSYQCLCKIEACATCTGTDQKHIQGKLPFPNDYPGILGHESVGRVVQVGSKVRNYQVGDRFLRPCAIYPGGRLGELYSVWGGFAEYGLVTDTKALLEDDPNAEVNPYTQFQQFISDDIEISAADATTLITLKEAASLVVNAGIKQGSSVVILGAGSVGISMCKFAKMMGAAPVIVVARRDEQLAHATTIGADAVVNTTTTTTAVVVDAIKELTGGRGADRIIDTAGSVELVMDAVQALSSDGKIVPYGMPETDGAITGAVSDDIVLGAQPAEAKAHEYVLGAVRLELLNLSEFYSHRLPFKDIVQGFELLKTKEAFKVVFEMDVDYNKEQKYL